MFVAVYLLSPYFACALPCCSFVEISPDVILRDEVRNVRICSIQNNRSIIKPRGWDFATTPTRFKVLNDYFRFVRVTSVRMLLVCNLFIFFTNQQDIVGFGNEVSFQPVDDSKFVLRKYDNIVFTIV